MRRLAFLAALLLASCLLLQAQAAAVLVPASDGHEYTLIDNMAMLQDPSRLLDISAVATTAASRFEPASREGPNYGFRKPALWFRMQVDFSGVRARDWHLVETHPLIDDITFYLPASQGNWQAITMGDTLPFAERLYAHREFILPIPRQLIDGPQPVTFHVRVASEGALNVDLRLTGSQALVERTNIQSWIFGLFYGALFVVMFYHLSLWIGTREPAQIYYVLMVAGLTLLFLSINGIGLQYLWPRLPVLNSWFPVFVCVALVGGVQFTRYFLDISRSNPRVDLVFHYLVPALIALILLLFVLSRQWAYITGAVLPVFFVLFTFSTGLLRLRQGYLPARLFVAGWGAFLVGTLLTALANIGTLKGMILPIYSAQAGVTVMILLLSLALGERVRYLKADNERIQRELAFSTHHDRLTGLPNRSSLENFLPLALAESQHNNLILGVLYIDIDDFKAINETWGHDTGDRILADVASRLQELVGNAGIVARISGDEFVAVLPNCDTADDVLLMAHNMIASISAPVQTSTATIDLTCSIGISIGESGLEHPMQLIQHADAAMQASKREGHNNYVLHTSDLNSQITQRIQLRNELLTAIRENQFIVHYQPIVDRRSDRACSFEALLRWNHPQRGIISAAEFIAVAEETGRIVQMGHRVLETACRDCARLLDGGLQDARVAVNISPIQFQRADFVDSVQAVLAATGLPGNRLELDVTESVLLDSIDFTRMNIENLKRLGVSVSIDDFGTGYSSLSYLRHLPVNKIKIDETFIHNVISTPQDAAITRAIIAIAHNLNLTVLAEGIETEAQYDFLHKAGCDQFQGNFFSVPIPISALEQYFFRGRSVEPRDARLGIEPQETILLVDDEQNILKALSRALRKDGYRILTAESAREAFSLLAQNDVQLIISDQRMPKMTGTEFLARVKDMYPHTVRIVLSGYTDLKSVTDAVNQGAIYRFLTKPWDDDTLREEVRQALLHFQRTARQ